MSIIYAAHGVVSGYDPKAFIHRNMIDREAAAKFLNRVKSKYVSLNLAHAHRGDSLTIDDGTVAAANLARLAREAGHEVTIFVNAQNVAHSTTYPFVLLNVYLDLIKKRTLKHGARIFNLGRRSDKSEYRRCLKKLLASMESDRQRENYIRELAESAGIDALPVPDHLRTLSVQELEQLLADGVRIENHGWSHRDLTGCDSESFREEIEKGQIWLAEELGVRSTAYAIPFGEALPPRRLQVDLQIDYYLLDARLNAGLVGHNLYNRLNLSDRRISKG